ncbi:MAG TPA: serine hydrolase domain-containing protein [Bryobacteraceae bacterium]|jgi:CubicO group peptidase (beta-lactamase class C family)
MRRLSFALLLPLYAIAADRPPVPQFTDPTCRATLEAALPQVTAVFEQFWRDQHVPGLVFGVVIDGDLVLVKGFGEQNRETHAPVTPDSVFRIASMTKSFTALAILQLRDAGKLSLEDPVSKWIPEIAGLNYPTRDTAPLRIRNLLTHGAGFPEDNPWGDRQLATPDATLTQLLKQGLPFSTPPDTAYEYSNYGFALLGRIVARASGVPYNEYIRRHILEPLHLRSATLDPADVPASVRAQGYGRSGDAYTEIPSLGYGAFSSMGGMLLNARDLGRYVAFHLSAWPPRDDPETGPVRRSSVREMQHPWRPSGFHPERFSAYGYGLAVTQICQYQRYVSHSGGLPGFGSNMAWLPYHGVGIFVMTNLTYTAGATAVEQSFEVLRKTGALQPRELPPSSELLTTRDQILRVWDSRQDLAVIAADNLFLDSPASDRLQQIHRLKERAGACQSAGALRPENLLRGSFTIPCQSANVRVFFTLAPTIPPKVQRLDFTVVPHLDPAAERAVETRAHQFGNCRFDEVDAWLGSFRASVRLECEHGSRLAQIEIGSDGKLRNIALSVPGEGRCAP